MRREANFDSGNICILGLAPLNGSDLSAAIHARPHIFAQADVILAPRPLLPTLRTFPHLRARVGLLFFPLEKFVKYLRICLDKKRKILILADGDPLYFGIGSSLLAFFGPDKIFLIPDLSCLQRAAAKIALPWHDIHSLSLHGRDSILPLLRLARFNKKICALFGNGPGPDAAARTLLDRGIYNYETIIFEKIGSVEEKISRLSLEQCAESDFGACSLLFLVPGDSAACKTEKDLRGPYHSSKTAAACALGLLSPGPDEIVWDLGSGSGSLALACSRSAYNGVVYALERDADRILDIQANRKNAGATNLVPVFGSAPEILATLPQPDKIFIGGGLSGKDGMNILKSCSELLKPGGKLVANCILLESLKMFQIFAAQEQWQSFIWQLQASELAELGKGFRLKPYNPLFVVLAEKPCAQGHVQNN